MVVNAACEADGGQFDHRGTRTEAVCTEQDASRFGSLRFTMAAIRLDEMQYDELQWNDATLYCVGPVGGRLSLRLVRFAGKGLLYRWSDS